MFFGRDDAFEFVRQALIGQHRDNIIVLYGQRRIGKTSLLYQIRFYLGSAYLCVFIDLHGFALEGLRGFLWELANHIVRVLRHDYQITFPALSRADFMIDPLISFEDEFLNHLWPIIGTRHVLLMFDEVIRLQEKVQAGTLDRSIFEYMRHLMQHHERLSFLFSLGSGLEEMEKDYAFLFNVALYKKLSFLDQNAARTLITEPVKDYYRFEQSTVEQILRMTSNHPYYIQLLCHSLFNHWQQHPKSLITTQDVKDVVDETVERGLAVLKHVWEESTACEKAILVGIAEIAKEPQRPVKVKKIHRMWANMLPEDEAARATRNLIARDVIAGQGSYTFTIELQRLWVRKYRRLEWVKEEIKETMSNDTSHMRISGPISRWERMKIPIILLSLILIVTILTYFILPNRRLLSQVGTSAVATATPTSVPLVKGVDFSTGINLGETQKLYTDTINKKPAFKFLYSSQDSKMRQISDQSSGTCIFTNNAYHIFVNVMKSPHNITACILQEHSFNNFIFRVQLTTVKGSGGGIIFRANPKDGKWYFFTINSEGEYDLYLYESIKSATSLRYKTDPTIIHPKMNKPDWLAVVAQQQDIYLCVNDRCFWKQFVGNTSPTYSSGDVGLLVANSQAPTDIVFDKAQVWEI